MDFIKIIIGFLSKTLNMTPEEVSDLLYKKTDNPDEKAFKEDLSDILLNADAERVKAIKKSSSIDEEAEKKLRDEGYKRAEKEVMTKFEDNLRKEFGLASKKQGTELVKDVIAAATKADDLTDEKVKKHPLYVNLETTSQKAIEELKTEHTTALENIKLEQKRESVLSSVRGSAKNLLVSLNPVISDNAVVASNREKDFLSKFDGYDYEPAGDDFILIDRSTGKRLENKQGHAIKLSEHAKEQASLYYEFKKQNPKGSPGGGEGGVPPSVTVPKSRDEYDDAIINAKTDEERSAIAQAWEASKKE